MCDVADRGLQRTGAAEIYGGRTYIRALRIIAISNSAPYKQFLLDALDVVDNDCSISYYANGAQTGAIAQSMPTTPAGFVFAFFHRSVLLNGSVVRRPGRIVIF